MIITQDQKDHADLVKDALNAAVDSGIDLSDLTI